MGACTVSIEQNNRYNDAERERIVAISPSASYATGGDTLAAADCQLAAINTVELEAVDAAGSRLGIYDKANSKIKVFTALGTEAVNATNQSAISFRAIVRGY